VQPDLSHLVVAGEKLLTGLRKEPATM